MCVYNMCISLEMLIVLHVLATNYVKMYASMVSGNRFCGHCESRFFFFFGQIL